MKSRPKIEILWLSVMAVCLCACSSRALHEAQDVVAQADSLWLAGQSFEDSTRMAAAYNTLGSLQYFYADEYAHACYHYGRLLRTKDNPVAAMQAFIAATHSHTSDYHILGRVYSNMGDICHKAAEYTLSYNMFECSADMFLRNGDSIAYLYALNDMAFEKAEMADSSSCLALLMKVEGKNISPLMTFTRMTKAKLNLQCCQYNAAISCIKNINDYAKIPSAIVIVAQAYSYLGQKDSAVYYAKLAMDKSKSLYEKNNALYILANDDETTDKKAILNLASARADIQEKLKFSQGDLSQAVQLLEQDLHRKPNLVWLYVMMVTIVVVSTCFLWRIKVRTRQMNRRVDELIEHQYDAITQSIKHHIDTNDIAHTLHWKNYELMKSDADLYMGGIVGKLEKHHLNETEIRFCVLTMLDFSLSHIADTIHYSYPSGIKTLKKRVSVKLGTTPPELRDFLFQMAINA